MATITNLNQTSPDQLRRIIEDNRIIIKKTDSTRYQIICPECDKPEAYIYFNQGSRVIQCNRQKNCNFSQSLWEYIASKHGYSNKEMTGYINELLGYEFKDFANEHAGSIANADNVHKEEKAPETLKKVITDKPIRTQEEITEEKPKLDPELQELLNQIEHDRIAHNKETLDIFKYAKRIKEIRTRVVGQNIALNKKNDPNFIALNNIYSDIREYNNLLSSDETEDRPYNCEQFLEEILKNTNNGLKTGFKDLDEYITIQPSSLAFIAGRPSHGKTTMMLNILKNMLEDKNNEDKAFLFYSYEETRSDILIKIILSVADDGLDQELMNAKVEGTNLRQMALNNLKNHPLCVRENVEGKISGLNLKLAKAYDKVNNWIKEGRLEILTPKSTAESLSTAIIERCTDFKEEEQPNEDNNQKEWVEEQGQQGRVKKKVAAVFIDYVQKLTTEEESANRQQEIQKICQSLLSTALDTRVESSIILGAQLNRNVTSFEELTLDKMRESGDIEQDANLVLGIWNEQAGEIDWLVAQLAELKEKLKKLELELDDLAIDKPSSKPNSQNTSKPKKLDKNKIQAAIDRVKNALRLQQIPLTTIQVKVLKNRNGQNNGLFKLKGYLDRYFIDDIPEEDRRITMQERSRNVLT